MYNESIDYFIISIGHFEIGKIKLYKTGFTPMLEKKMKKT